MKIKYTGKLGPFFVVGVSGVIERDKVIEVTPEVYEKLKNIEGIEIVNEPKVYFKKEQKEEI